VQFSFDGAVITVNLPDAFALEDAVRGRLRSGRGFALATINLDHLVKLQTDNRFRSAYTAQDFVVADGRPITWLSRIAGRNVALLPGSDLVLPLASMAAEEGARIALIGTTMEALQNASDVISNAIPNTKIVLLVSPSRGFDPHGPEADAILERLASEHIGLCFLALGAPKQELFAARGRQAAPATGFACIGAGLDFLGGHQRRAPAWVRAAALEWAWRAATSPLRLGPRYARCAAILPGQVRAARGLARK
jgi:exopolysaccharide biosynthesis WecB/TagA/CpsF family protein